MRGVALVQALVIVAALALVSVALLQRSDTARLRLEDRFAADQAGLYLDSGVDLVRANLPQGVVHLRQDWATPREGVRIDRGLLGWRIEDLQGRFNLSLLGADPQGLRRAMLVRLLRGQGVEEPLANALGAALVAPITAQSLTALLADPRLDATLRNRLAALLIVLPPEARFNVNTLRAPILAAMLPGAPAATLAALSEQIASEPVSDLETFVAMARAALGDEAAESLTALPLNVTSRHFALQIEARLDSVILRRAVVLDTGAGDGRAAIVQSFPEFE